MHRQEPEQTARSAPWRPRRIEKAATVIMALAAAVAASASPTAAQTPAFPLDPARASVIPDLGALGTPRDELTRIGEITGALPYRSRVIRRASTLPGEDSTAVPRATLVAWPGGDLAAVPLTLDAGYLTGYPDDRNNGLRWSGRGASVLARGGVRARWRWLSAGLAPELAWQENRAFDHRPVTSSSFSEFIYPYHGGIDYPQRFGEDAFVSTGWGQSWIRVDVVGAAAGVSTENLWWGPALRYPLVMSSTAPGFPHAFLGTGRPVDVGIGRLEAELVWGRLSESEYYDIRPDNDHPSFMALVAAFSPHGLDGLTVGGARLYHLSQAEASWLGGFDPLRHLFGGSAQNRSGNEIVTIFGRWVFPESGAEVYGEWGRDDRWYDLNELVQEPDHSQAYMVGFQKVTPLGDLGRTALRVHAEIVALQEKGELTRTGSRPLPVWYTHSAVRQGHTHRGQLLGAGGIGVGADAQFLGIDAVKRWGMLGGFVERVRRNEAARAAVDARAQWEYEHDAELTGGVRALFLPSAALSVSARLSFGYRYNRDFDDDDRNVGLELSATWLPHPGAGR